MCGRVGSGVGPAGRHRRHGIRSAPAVGGSRTARGGSSSTRRVQQRRQQRRQRRQQRQCRPLPPPQPSHVLRLEDGEGHVRLFQVLLNRHMACSKSVWGGVGVCVGWVVVGGGGGGGGVYNLEGSGRRLHQAVPLVGGGTCNRGGALRGVGRAAVSAVRSGCTCTRARRCPGLVPPPAAQAAASEPNRPAAAAAAGAAGAPADDLRLSPSTCIGSTSFAVYAPPELTYT